MTTYSEVYIEPVTPYEQGWAHPQGLIHTSVGADGTVRLWDSVAGQYTSCYDTEKMARVVRFARAARAANRQTA